MLSLDKKTLRTIFNGLSLIDGYLVVISRTTPQVPSVPSTYYKFCIDIQKKLADVTEDLIKLDKDGSKEIVEIVDKLILLIGNVITHLKPVKKHKEWKKDEKTTVIYQEVNDLIQNIKRITPKVRESISDYYKNLKV